MPNRHPLKRSIQFPEKRSARVYIKVKIRCMTHSGRICVTEFDLNNRYNRSANSAVSLWIKQRNQNVDNITAYQGSAKSAKSGMRLMSNTPQNPNWQAIYMRPIGYQPHAKLAGCSL